MSGINFAMSSIIAVLALSFVSVSHASDSDPALRADLERIAQKHIFFGHQSVGVNLLDGVKQLAISAGVPVQIDEVTLASGVKPAAIGHTFIARNGDPFQKIQSFEQAMGPQSTGLNVALMKFCYVDFNSDTDVKALFARYRAAVDALRTKNPGTTFVHVTAPLTVVYGGLKASLKKLFGQAPYGIMENMRREEYNTLLRQTYQGREPIFDLARVESTAPNGAAVSVEWKGSVVPVMNSAYTDDGGHLNTVGKLRAARELIALLAAIPDHSATR